PSPALTRRRGRGVIFPLTRCDDPLHNALDIPLDLGIVKVGIPLPSPEALLRERGGGQGEG
ncbi:MAG: hypothetical protein ACE5MB_10845, partial [Anaerolineae bacterium]